MTHALMSYISGAKTRVGLGGGMSNIFLNNPIAVDYTKVIQWCEKNLFIVHACGLKINSDELELWYDSEDIRIAKNILGDFAPNRLKIAFGLGANHIERRYPVKKYLVALKKIINKGAAIVILGGPSEMDDAKFLEDNLPKKFVLNVVKLNLGWRIDSAIISQTDMYLGNDTGTQHVSATLKKPVIVLSRDSKDHERTMQYYCEHIRFAPYHTESIVLMPEHSLGDCAQNLQATCWAGKSHCIAQITPEEIIAAFDEMLKFVKI